MLQCGCQVAQAPQSDDTAQYSQQPCRRIWALQGGVLLVGGQLVCVLPSLCAATTPHQLKAMTSPEGGSSCASMDCSSAWERQEGI
jgi:hypothetical protein